MELKSAENDLSLKEKQKVIDEIHASIDGNTMEALNRVAPDLGEALKSLQTENIEFGECVKLRKCLFSGKIRMGSLQQHKEEAHYNSYLERMEYNYVWRNVQYFYDKKFTNYSAWLICNTDQDYISPFKEDIKDLYAKYSMNTYGCGGRDSDTVFASEDRKKEILTLKDKKHAALSLAFYFGERLVWESTKTSVQDYRCGAISLDSYTCNETDEYAELPICPIYILTKDGTKEPIGAFLTTSKIAYIQFYGKEEEIDKVKSEIVEVQRKQRKKRRLKLGLKIVSGILPVIAAVVLALIIFL